jgi:Protein of unknown function (DUF2800)
MEPDTQDPRKGWTSASNADADLACPGRHLAQKNTPHQTSADAEFGKGVHAALATNDPSKLTTEQLDIYESCVAIETRFVDQLFGPEKAKCKTFVEQRFWVKVKARNGDGYFSHSGQPDKVYRLGPRGLIIDYKSLASQVAESATNGQLRDYVCLAAGNLMLTEIMAIVIQPLITTDPVPCLYDKTSIKQAEDEMFARVRRSNDPASPRVAGEVQCKFCLAKPNCKEYGVWAAALLPARVALPDLPVAEWTVDQRIAFCEGVGAVEQWISDNKEAMKQLLTDNPDAVPGFYLKPGAVRELVSDPEALFARFVELGGTLDQFMACVSITKGKLEDNVRTVTGKKGKGLKSEMDKMLDGIVEQKQNAPSIAKRK